VRPGIGCVIRRGDHATDLSGVADLTHGVPGVTVTAPAETAHRPSAVEAIATFIVSIGFSRLGGPASISRGAYDRVKAANQLGCAFSQKDMVRTN
jgi:hypothetical protein